MPLTAPKAKSSQMTESPRTNLKFVLLYSTVYLTLFTSQAVLSGLLVENKSLESRVQNPDSEFTTYQLCDCG